MQILFPVTSQGVGPGAPLSAVSFLALKGAVFLRRDFSPRNVTVSWEGGAGRPSTANHWLLTVCGFFLFVFQQLKETVMSISYIITDGGIESMLSLVRHTHRVNIVSESNGIIRVFGSRC